MRSSPRSVEDLRAFPGGHLELAPVMLPRTCVRWGARRFQSHVCVCLICCLGALQGEHLGILSARSLGGQMKLYSFGCVLLLSALLMRQA